MSSTRCANSAAESPLRAAIVATALDKSLRGTRGFPPSDASRAWLDGAMAFMARTAPASASCTSRAAGCDANSQCTKTLQHRDVDNPSRQHDMTIAHAITRERGEEPCACTGLRECAVMNLLAAASRIFTEDSSAFCCVWIL
jgi:hypothetical protein